MMITGTRHAMFAKYQIAIDVNTLKIGAYDVEFWSNAGHTVDLSDAVMGLCFE